MAVLPGRPAPILPATAGHPHPRWPAVVAAVLTFGTGALDVTTLTHLGGVFASVMTGNFALTGLAFARTDAALLTHTAVGLAGYVLGVAAGTRITGRRDSDGPLWPRSVTAALAVQFGVLFGLAVGWEATGATPTGTAQLALLAAAAVAMGLQGAAMRGLGVTVTTTYLTGTLTGVIAALTGSPRARCDRAAVAALIAAIGGAACEGVVLGTVPSAVPLLMLAPVAAVLAIAEYRHRRGATASAPKARTTAQQPGPDYRRTRVIAPARSAVGSR
jgi:uncharacterized membrane protein YoaK (UPF0700 family)